MMQRSGMRGSAHLRFAACAFLMLLLATVYLGTTFFSYMEERRVKETETRVQLLADLLAKRIASAVQLGIPLDKLEGVTALFTSIRDANSEILSVELVDASQRVLWKIGSSFWDDGNLAPRGADGSKVASVVRVQDKDVARIVIERQAESLRELLLETTLLILLAVLATVVAATEAARYALGFGPRLRDDLVTLASRRAADGVFETLFVAGARRPHDLRPQWITSTMRRVNEQHVRVRRLIESLRQTEPNAQRRRSLDHLLDQAGGTDAFAASMPVVVRLYPIEAQMRWLLVLAACSAESLRVLWHVDQIGLAGWGIALAACGTGFGYRMATRFRKQLFALAPGALVIAALVLLLNVYATHPGLLLVLRGVMGMALGTLLAAAAWVENPALDGMERGAPSLNAVAAPACTTLVLAGWLIGAEWLGPIMGSLAVRVLGPQYGALLLMLPLVAALVSSLRWTAIHGVWHVRQDGVIRATGKRNFVAIMRQMLPVTPHQMACMVLGAMIAMLAMFEPQLAGTIDRSFLVLLWTASGAGALAALYALTFLHLPPWLMRALAFAGPGLLALSLLPGIHPAWTMVLPVAGIALSSAAWWTLYVADTRLPHEPGFYLLAAGAALQSLLHLTLPAGYALIAWTMLAALAALASIFLMRRRA